MGSIKRWYHLKLRSVLHWLAVPVLCSNSIQGAKNVTAPTPWSQRSALPRVDKLNTCTRHAVLPIRPQICASAAAAGRQHCCPIAVRYTPLFVALLQVDHTNKGPVNTFRTPTATDSPVHKHLAASGRQLCHHTLLNQTITYTCLPCCSQPATRQCLQIW